MPAKKPKHCWYDHDIRINGRQPHWKPVEHASPQQRLANQHIQRTDAFPSDMWWDNAIRAIIHACEKEIRLPLN